LHYACTEFFGSDEVIELLIQCWPESVQMATKADGSLPLHLYAGLGARAFVREEDSILACHGGKASWTVMQSLVQAWPDAVRVPDKRGYLPLHYACSKGKCNLEMIQYLIQCWPESVQCRCTGGALPLHLACKSSSRQSNKNLLPVIQTLLEAWPDSVRELDDQGFLPLHYACNNNGAEDDVIQYLVRACPDACHIPVKSHDILPLHLVLRSSTTRLLETIRLLLEAGPDAVRKPDSRGLLPLHYACERGGTHDVIQFLIEQWPLSLSTKTKDGNLPLHFALLNNKKLSLETIQLLVQACPAAVHEHDH